MVVSVFISLVMRLGLSIFVCPSPLFLGIWVLMIALFSSLIIGIITYSWLGIFIYIIYVGGLLVMFSYFVALRPNQVYRGQRLLGLLGVVFLSSLVVVFRVDLKVGGCLTEFWGSRIIYFFQSNLFLFVVIGVRLFIVIVRVVKLCGCYVAPLRRFK